MEKEIFKEELSNGSAVMHSFELSNGNRYHFEAYKSLLGYEYKLDNKSYYFHDFSSFFNALKMLEETFELINNDMKQDLTIAR